MRIREAVWVGAFALAIVGCGEDRECGAGTVPMDGVCVPTSMIMCGAGTVMDANGDCVPASEGTVCGAGTTLNAETGECEPDIECGTGTVAMSGECVPDGTVICDDGTMFDAATGTCVVRDGTGLCGEGTTLIDGECVPNDDTLMADYFAAAEPDDPGFDGVPGSFVPPAIGAQSTFEGCITAADFDGDDVTDLDLDFFTFSVAQAGLFRIHADGLGGAAAAFAIVAFDGPLADAGWIRLGLNYTGDSSERRIFVPRPGNYALVVFDSRSFSPTAGFAFPVGNDDTCYFVTVEAEDIPAATPIAPGTPVTGTLGDPQFYSYTATDVQSLQIIHNDDSPVAVGAALSVVGAEASAGNEGQIEGLDNTFFFSPVIPDGGEALIVADYVFNLSLDPVGWDMSIKAVNATPDDGTVTLNNDPDDPLGQFALIETTVGEVIHITFETTETIDIVILKPDLTGELICANCSVGDVYYAVADAGPHLLWVQDTSAATDADYTIDFVNRRQTPMTLTPGTPLDLTLVDTRTFVRVDTSAQLWTRYELSAFVDGMDPQLFTAADVSLHPDAAGILPDPGADFADGVDDWFGRIHGPDMGAMQLIGFSDSSGAFDMDESVTVSFDDEDFEDVIIDHLTPFADSVAIAADSVEYFLVRGLPGGVLTFEVSGTDGADPVIDVLDEVVATVDTINVTPADGVETFTILISAQTPWFAFAVRTADGAAGTVNVGVSQTPPPYTSGPGTTVFSSICPSDGGDGELVVMVDNGFDPVNDEGFSAATTFSTFTGFEYFGAPVTSYRAHTNGWLTFATGAITPPDYGIPPLGTAGLPNSIVAPLGRDLISEEVCVLEEAGRFTVEWRGTGAAFVGGNVIPFGNVQVQAIFTSADGNIELVYSSRHDVGRLGADDVAAEIGLESPDGTVGVPGGDATPASSTLFVPTTTP